LEQRALRRLGQPRSAVEVQALGELTADELSHLAEALDGALEIFGPHCRLQWPEP
jgi:hypothetical protein